MQDIHIAIDYANRKVGDIEYLLPVHSMSSDRVGGKVFKSESEFNDYRKFSVDAAVSFGAAPDKKPIEKQ
jgi:hypothetical protein